MCEDPLCQSGVLKTFYDTAVNKLQHKKWDETFCFAALTHFAKSCLNLTLQTWCHDRYWRGSLFFYCGGAATSQTDVPMVNLSSWYYFMHLCFSPRARPHVTNCPIWLFTAVGQWTNNIAAVLIVQNVTSSRMKLKANAWAHQLTLTALSLTDLGLTPPWEKKKIKTT